MAKESALRDITEGKEIELRRENASIRYVFFSNILFYFFHFHTIFLLFLCIIQ